LLGVDALAVLDEAHLVPPFENLLEAVDRNTDSFGQRSDLCNIIPRSKVLSLSATGGARHGNIFRLCEPDLHDEVVKSRLEAKKAIGLIELGDRKLEEALAEEAWRLTNEGASFLRCLIYCDSRETAEKTKAEIEQKAKSDKKRGISRIELETELFVGA